MKKYLAAALALGCSVALSADRVPVVQVKFSPNSTRVMALSVGSLDGSGFSFAQINVLNTTNGQTVYQRSRTKDAPLGTVRAQLLTLAPTPAALAGNGLTPGVVSVPKFVRNYAHPWPEYSEATLAGQTQVTSVPLWTAPVPIKLSVFARPAACTNPDILNGYQAAGFRLTVRNQVIHADGLTPDNHGCAVGYTVERVDVRGNRILVTVRAYSFGFEGPDAKAIFVAAKLN